MSIWMRAWLSLALWLSLLAGPIHEEGTIIRYHPAGELRAGDVVSIEVISPPGTDLNGQAVTVSLVSQQSSTLGQAEFSGFIEGRQRAILQWVWDTHGLQPGSYRLRFVIPGQNQSWVQTVWLGAAEAGEAARWMLQETACCRVHFISGTAAERDIDMLAATIDAQASRAAAALDVRLNDKLDVNLIPRVLGQGGFASDEIYVTYSDENYLNGQFAQLILHEMIHRLDALKPSGLRPTLLMEGLAVYLGGGHYREEPVMLRAAALIDLDRYVPLTKLADAFYPAQHESGYIEAGALVEFMSQTWGWERFEAFYRDIHEQKSGSQAAAIDEASRRHFGLSLEMIEERFLTYLKGLPVIPDVREDVDLTIRLYDSIRAYQKALDPSAYFEQVWLPDANAMRERGIVADYLRAPDGPKNRAIEALLQRAGQRIQENEAAGAEADLEQADRMIRQSTAEPAPMELKSGVEVTYASTP